MNNDRIDLSRESLNNEGNIWLNRKTKQLRTSLGKNEPNSWYNPISSYEVGSENKLRRGQPVSVGYLDQLYSESKLSGDSCIVPTNPSINQWCIGLALEPGFHRDGNSVKKIHVQSNGQIEYDLSTKDDDDYYLPPHSDTKFEWNYDDIGKPVFVSNKNPGELTLDIAEAAYNGGTIVCVGRIADAPLADEKNISLQKIVLEVQLSGDVRGVVDTSQIQVEIASKSKHASLGIQVENLESDLDRVFFFFIKDGFAYFILDDETVNKYSQNSPVGALVVNSKDGVLDIESLLGKKTLIFRLGLLKGNFGFSKVGNTAYLSNGFIDESAASSSYDYKVGVILSKDSILIDCRYPRFVAKKTMIGDIKPLFENGLCEPGYAKIDNEVHKVIFDKNDPVCADGIDWKYLVEGTYTKDLFVFSRSKDGPFTTILEGGWTPDGANEDSTGFLNKYTYFKFRDLVYTIGNNTCGCQIKFSKDDAPEAMNYIWPEQTFELSLVPDPGREDDENYVLGGNLSSSKLKLDISKLTALGQYMDSNGQNIEAYDIIVREKTSNQLISSGFYQVESDGQMKWCGYEWKVSRDSYTNQTFLTMVTVPGEEPNSKCLGFCWPIGQKLTSKVDLYVTVRRRPTQYHDLYLNQINQNNPWAPYTDGNNLITGDSIFFGAKLKETPADSGVGQNSGYNKENIGTGEIHFSSSNNEGSINTIITEPDSDENRIKVFYDIKSVATRANNDRIRRFIKWGYDFEDNVTTLSSAFAPSLVQPSTRNKFISGFDGENHLTAKDYKNEDALQILHEFQPKILNYADDDNNTKQNWKKISFIFDEILKAKTSSNEYELYGSDDENLESTKYSISSSLKSAIEKTIGYLYGNSNGYMSYISNLGLLNAAAKNTQDRLLKIERALFGSDFYTNPQGRAEKKESNYLEIDNTISNAGILRDIKSLRQLGVIDDRKIEERLLDKENGISSVLKEFYATNYMDYNSYEMFEEMKHDFDVKESFSEKDPKNHLLDLWIDYCNSNRINYQLSFTNSFINKKRTLPIYDYSSKRYVYIEDNFKKITNSLSADRIFLRKYLQKYNNETKEVDTSNVLYNNDYAIWQGSLLKWPINADSDFSIDLYDNFFNSTFAGIDDYIDDQHDKTFNAQSLEGLVLDIYSKLSFIKDKFDDDGNIKASIFNKFYNFDSNETFKISSEEQKYDDGVYSAFSISNNRFKDFYRVDLIDSLRALHYGNNYRYDENSLDDFDKFTSNLSKYSTKNKNISIRGYGTVKLLEKPLQYFVFLGLFAIAYELMEDQYDKMNGGEGNGFPTQYPGLVEAFKAACKVIFPQYYTSDTYTLLTYFVGQKQILVTNELGLPVLDEDGNYTYETDYSYFMEWVSGGDGQKVKNTSKNQKEYIDFYINNFICNTEQYNGNATIISAILDSSLDKTDKACKILYPDYYDASSDFLSYYGFSKQKYECNTIVYKQLIHNILDLYSSNPDKKLIVEYTNTRDADQYPFNHYSNDFNKYLKSYIDPDYNSVMPHTFLSKINETEDDIILERRYREILQTHEFEDGEVIEDRKVYAAPLITSKMPRSDYYDEEFVRFNGFDLFKNGSLKIKVSSLKEALNKYNENLFESLNKYNENLSAILREYNSHLISSIDEYNTTLLSKLNDTFTSFDLSGETATKKTVITHSEKELSVQSVTADEILLDPIPVSIGLSSSYNKSDFKVTATVEGGTYSHKIDAETISVSVEGGTYDIYKVNEDGTVDKNTIIGKAEIPAKEVSITIPEKTVSISIPEKAVSCDLTDTLDSILRSVVNKLYASTQTSRHSLPNISKIKFAQFDEDFPSLIVPSTILEDDFDTSGSSSTETFEDVGGIKVDHSNFDSSDIESSNPIKDFKIKDEDNDELEEEEQTPEYKINDFVVREDPIKDFDLENPEIEDLGLNVLDVRDDSIEQEAEPVQDDKALTIERQGDLYPYGYIEQVQKLFVDRAFNNRSIVKNINKLTSKKTGSEYEYKQYYTSQEEIYSSIKNLPFNDFETSITDWRPANNVILDFVNRVTDSIYVNREHLKILITYICEDPAILNAKIDFIFDKCGLTSIRIRNISTLYEDLSRAYNNVKLAYDNEVQKIINSNILLDKPMLKDGFYLYGKQQKRPDIMFSLTGSDVLNTIEKDLVKAPEKLVLPSSNNIKGWSTLQYALITDVFDRRIQFTIDGKEYGVSKFTLLKVSNFTNDQLLTIIDTFKSRNKDSKYGFNKEIVITSKNFILIPTLQYIYRGEVNSDIPYEYISLDDSSSPIKHVYTSLNEDVLVKDQQVLEQESLTINYVPSDSTKFVEDIAFPQEMPSIKVDFDQKLDFLLQNSHVIKTAGFDGLNFNQLLDSLEDVEQYRNSIKSYQLSEKALNVHIG